MMKREMNSQDAGSRHYAGTNRNERGESREKRGRFKTKCSHQRMSLIVIY